MTGPELTWTELRIAVTVGTERRALPSGTTLPGGTARAGAGSMPPEQVALHAAALLGAARRSGLRPAAGTPPAPEEERAGEPEGEERVAPDRAVQLLELLLEGNLGRQAAVQPLVAAWLEQAAARGLVLPHHLVLAALERGTADRTLQPLAAPALGRRGRWLATWRPEWAWAADGHRTGTAEELLGVESAERLAAVRAARAADADHGRSLVEALLAQVDAAGRAGLLAALAVGLGPGDEDLLERALDDRSGPVRTAAVRLLEGLPGSARAARCARRLAPVVHRQGRFRPTLSVSRPAPPEGDERRDEPPGSEAHWLRTLVAGTPLGWWEQTLGLTPERIVGLRLDAAGGPPGWEADVVGGWARAATAQRNPAWAVALLDRPELTATHRTELVTALLPPWSLATAEGVLAWLERQTKPGFVVDALTPHLAAALPPAAADRLTAWLARVNKADDLSLHRNLRHLLQLLSTRHSIVEAFT